jgi:hypothetical protein
MTGVGKTYCVYTTDEDQFIWDELERWAASEDRSMSWVIRQIVKDNYQRYINLKKET